MIGLLWVCFNVSGQAQKTVKEPGKPFVLGRIIQLHSNELGEERTLNVYLPEGYNADDTSHYPVIYLLDGGADEDFIHIVVLVQFNNFSWINRVPKSIVIGIANVDRKRDFTYPTLLTDDSRLYPTTGHSATFMAFIEKELEPFVQKTFRTNNSKTIIGESLGGLLATEILFKKPALFNNYIIISPSLWWDNGSLLTAEPQVLKTDWSTPTQVYIGVGKEGLTPGKSPRVMEVDANLLAEKIKAAKNKNVTTYFDYLPNETHATIIHQAVFNAFRLLYPGKEE